MPILRSLVSWLTIKRVSQIELFKKYPLDVQKEELNSLIRKAQDTEYGILHGFRSIDSVEEFRVRVPICDYEDIKPYVIRLRHGEQNLLWPTDIKWFAKSSGTTSDKSKFIPVSKEALENCHFRGGKDALVLYTHKRPDTRIYKGKCLVLGGSHKINNFSNESYYGDLSAVIIQNLPYWAEFIRTPNQEITLIEQWDEKIERMAQAAMKDNVTNIAGVPSWTLILLKRILEISGKDNLKEVWPDLELFTHGGVSFVPYREQFRKIMPENMNYMETYNASEGCFGIQDDPDDDSMLLMLDYGIFYEFIPVENVHDKDPVVLTLENVVINKNYAIVITSNGGLWRYMIGDTIQFTSLFPFKIRVTGRIKHFINAFGEELIIDNAEKALQIACSKTNAQIREFTAGPVYMDDSQTGGHQWLIEFEKPPEDLEYFGVILDNALKSLNSDYEAKRYKNMTLRFPNITVLKQGVFYAWMKDRGKIGGQNKVPRLSNDRQIIEVILDINSKL